MRIDLFLKKTRVIKQREAAKQACDQRRVAVNGQPAKPGRPIRSGDVISIDFPDRRLEIEVVEIPSGNVSKARSQTLYRILSDQDLTGKLLQF